VSVRVCQGLGIGVRVQEAVEADRVLRTPRLIVDAVERAEVGGVAPEAKIVQVGVAGLVLQEAALVAPGRGQAARRLVDRLAVGVVAECIGNG